jgi:hypothetical protein
VAVRVDLHSDVDQGIPGWFERVEAFSPNARLERLQLFDQVLLSEIFKGRTRGRLIVVKGKNHAYVLSQGCEYEPKKSSDVLDVVERVCEIAA